METNKRFEIFCQSQLELEIWDGDKIVFQSKKPGLNGLMEFIERFNHNFENLTIFDQMVGRGAALLAVYANVKKVYALIGSESAATTLKDENIDFVFKEIVPNILNREGTDLCPLEKLSLFRKPIEFYQLLKKSLQTA